MNDQDHYEDQLEYNYIYELIENFNDLDESNYKELNEFVKKYPELRNQLNQNQLKTIGVEN